MTAPKRVLAAGLFHETHNFVEGTTGLDGFEIRRDDEIMDHRGDGSIFDGLIEVADREGWDFIPTVEYRDGATATVEHSVFEQFWAEFEPRLDKAMAEKPLDGLLLMLHGAMVTTESVDPEGDLLARIRAKPGFADMPIFGEFDLHANFTKRMAELSNALVGFRYNPHTDIREGAVRAANLLARSFKEGALPRMLAKQAPVIWAPTGTGTGDRPMKDLEALARQIENDDPDIWVCNVIGGFAFSDVPEAGVAFSIATTGSLEKADAHLDKLVALAVELRELGVPDEWDIDAAIEDVKGKPGVHLIVEPADNIGGGGPGDCTPVLRAFLRHKLTNACVVIADPESVAAFEGAKPGEVRRVRIGGKGTPMDDGPVEIDAKFVSHSDGRFTLEDRHSHMAAGGIHINMRPCTVVTVGENDGVTVLLTGTKVAPLDLGQLRSQGIIPETLSYIGVKAAIAHRQAYDKIMTTSHTVVTGGPCTSDLTKLPYTKLRRPIFPLDPIPGT